MSREKELTIRENWKCFVACSIIILAPFQYGLDFGMIGGLQAMPGFLKVFGHEAPETPLGWNIDTVRQQLISSLMTLGAFITSASAGVIAKWLGRRACLWLASALCAVANIMMMTTTDIGALYVGRFIIGCSNGYFVTFSQLYLQECSPAKYRGLFLTGYQFFTSFGTLIGTVVDNETATFMDKSAYLIPLGVIYILPAIMTVAMFFIPESPRWLLAHNKPEQARRSLLWLRPSEEQAERELVEIQTALEIEQRHATGNSLMQLINNPVDRRRTGLCLGAVGCQAASGAMFIIAYKTYFLGMAGADDPFLYSVVLSVGGCVVIILNSFVVVRYGRRRYFLGTGLAVCGFAQLIIAIVYDKNPGSASTGKSIVGLSAVYMVVYSGAVAPYAWLSGGEMPSQRLRSYTFGLSAALGFLGAWLATFTAPYFINPDSLDWGPRYGYIWFPSCIVTSIWVFMFLPETKGRTLEQINEMFEKRVSAWKFHSYQCTSIGEAEEQDPKKSLEETVMEEKIPAKESMTTV
ncbi:general substrate transporter [Lineolata rhizophorae]|uniref:General substrate transporter n=1 Tax=Lineolata rhizophorae TaxID=578093 RepID=A0A6A6NP73_9PEZI|nr:general substrate transporter [Lineolata rhizophorae]